MAAVAVAAHPLDGLIVPGDLVFDVGANHGDYAREFIAHGAAQVVCVEPQPQFERELAALGVEVVGAAASAEHGRTRLHVSSLYPHLSTVSPAWMRASGYLQLHGPDCWDHTIDVPMVTLDWLRGAYGEPGFIKIDVEGGEVDVLRGLSYPTPALCFEAHADFAAAAFHCEGLLQHLATYEFNLVARDSWRLQSDRWVPRVADLELPVWGDIYARRVR